MPAGVVIAEHPLDDPVSLALVAELDAELMSHPGENFLELDPDEVVAGQGAFLVAWLDGEPVGCGAFRRLDDGRSAEVKRMYVRPAARGRKISAAMLSEIERLTRSIGIERLALETGEHLVQAVGLYTAFGYVRCACWGEYAESPDSICFSKELVAG